MARWRSCAPPTCIRSSCCRKAMPNRQPSLGLRCQIRATGRAFDKLTGEPHVPVRVLYSSEELMEENMGRGILLWLLGVPIPVIILLWLFFGREPRSILVVRKRPGIPVLFACPINRISGGALFDPFSDMTRWERLVGSGKRGGHTSGPNQDLGSIQLGQCSKSTVVPERTGPRL